MTFQNLTPEFSAFAAEASWQIVDQGDIIVVSEPGGETRYHVRREENGWASVARASRSAEPVVELWTDAADVVERYLTVVVGNQFREIKGLSRVQLPGDDDGLEPGYSVRLNSDGRWRLGGTPADSTVLFADHGDAFPAIQFSHYADAPLDSLRQSLVNPGGEPVFIGFVGRALRS